MSQTTKQEVLSPTADDHAPSSPIRTRSPSRIDETNAHDREDYLDDDKAEHLHESLEPPIKRLRVELPAEGGQHAGSGPGGVQVITGAPFDEAWKGTGTQAEYFRANMQEGAKSIMKRLEVNIRHGLALWAKGISALISDGNFFVDREPEKPVRDEPYTAGDAVKGEWTIPPPPETEDMIKLEGLDFERLTDGLSFVEALSFGTGRGQPRLPLVYVVEESLHIGEVDFYEPTHRIVLCVEKLNGETLGPSMVAFMRAILELGAHVRVAKLSLPERPVYKAAAQKIVAEKLTPYNQGPCFVGSMRYIPPPPATHAARQARTFAILSAVGHFVHKAQPAQPPPAEPPRMPGMMGMGGMNMMAPPAMPAVAQPMQPAAYPPTGRAMPAPPSMRKLFGAQTPAPAPVPAPTTTVNHWTDLRLTALPQWVISCLMELASRFDGQVVAALDQAWYSNYASHIEFRNFGFTGLHDVISNLPGIHLSNEGNEYVVRTFPHIMEEAAAQKWNSATNARPTTAAVGHEKPGPQQAHVDKQRLMLMQQMLQMQMQLAAIAGAAAASGQSVAGMAQNRYQMQAHQAAAAAAYRADPAAPPGDQRANMASAMAAKKGRTDLTAQWVAQHRK